MALDLLFVIDTLASGGAQHQMVRLACELSERGHRVEFFVYHPDHDHLAPRLRERGIAIHAATRGRPIPVSLLRDLRRRLHGGRYDAALAFLTAPSAYALAARFPHRRPALVVSERNILPGADQPLRRALRPLMHLADAIVVNARHVQRSLPQRLAARSQWIANGVDLTHYRPGAARVHAAADEPLRVLGLGSVIGRKRPLDLARALIRLRDVGAPLPRVSWAGRFEHTPAARQTHREVSLLLHAAGLYEQWSWLGPRDDVPALFDAHDALVHPGCDEGSPNAVCEALACGRPVVASATLDHPYLLGDGERGLLFEPRSPADLSRALQELQEMAPDSRRAMGARARAFAEAQLGMARFGDAYETLFERLVGASA